MSPSISARGMSAATESMTTRSTAFDLMSSSQISSACSPVSGCETSRLARSTPSFLAHVGSSACSASMNAATPPSFCIAAIVCSVSVVLPEDSGPKTSMIRPRGMPRPPRARSRLSAPVCMPGTMSDGSSSSRMIEPLPYVFSICPSALSSARALPEASIEIGCVIGTGFLLAMI